MKLKLTLLTLALLSAPAFAQTENPMPADWCQRMTLQCEANRIAAIAGCVITGRSQAFCTIDAQQEYLVCLSDIGCFEEEE